MKGALRKALGLIGLSVLWGADVSSPRPADWLIIETPEIAP
jgi:hypothetical protein